MVLSELATVNNETEPITQFFLFLDEDRTSLSKKEVLEFFHHNFTTDVSKIIETTQDGYSKNLISILIDKYHDLNLILDLYTIVAPIANNVEQLFWISESSNWNSDHPVNHMYVVGLAEVFQLISVVYSRKFSMLYEVTEYCDPSCSLEHILEDSKLLEDLRILLKSYNVTDEEFDYGMLPIQR